MALKLLSVLLAIACSVLVPVAALLAAFSPMSMDAPESHQSWGKWLFVLALVCAPFALLGAAVFAWKRIMAGNYALVPQYCLLSLIPLAVALLLLKFDWFDKK